MIVRYAPLTRRSRLFQGGFFSLYSASLFYDLDGGKIFGDWVPKTVFFQQIPKENAGKRCVFTGLLCRHFKKSCNFAD